VLIAYENERLPHETINFIEKKLYKYPVFKKAVQACEEQIVDIRTGTKQWSEEPPPTTFQQDSNVENKAIKILVLERKMKKYAYWVDGIDDVMSTLNETEKELIRLKYFENNLNHTEVAGELNVGRTTYYEIRNSIMERFALYFNVE
jgi:ArpU family phage transcriptional regulator